MKKLLWIVVLAAIAALIGWGIRHRNAPPAASFAQVRNETLISTLSTNGKVEPSEWQAVHAENKGVVSQLNVAEGSHVAKGAVLAVLSDPTYQAELDAAQAHVAEAEANLKSLGAGPKPAEVTEIDNSLAQANETLKQAQREQASLERLASQQAATKEDVTIQREKVDQIKVQIEGLQKRRTVLAAGPDLEAAQARVHDAQASLDLVKRRAAQNQILAPLAGSVYGLAIRAGAYLNAGDLVANIGVLDRLRVRVYIDEPELGRVAINQPVTITWQALPGKEWQGMVEKMPATIEPLGSRQVGQVICMIANPNHELVPSTNVDAQIRTAVVPNALTIPKEAMRHDTGGDYVLLLQGDTLQRRDVKTGASSVTRIQIASGLNAGDSVALPSETPLQPGERVTVTPAK